MEEDKLLSFLWNEDKKSGFSEKKSKYQTEILEGKTKLLSKMYNVLLEWDTKDEEIKEVMVKWAIDLGYNIDFDKWTNLWNKGMKFTASSTLRENLEKMMYRWYITPVKLVKMYKMGNKACWKCKSKDGDLYHMWWTCEKMKSFWELIYNELKKIFRYTFPKKPEAFLLGIIGDKIKKIDRKLFQYATVAARILVAQKWKTSEIPTVMEWQVKLFECTELAKMTHRIRNQEGSKFVEEWSKFVTYIETNCRSLRTTAGLT